MLRKTKLSIRELITILSVYENKRNLGRVDSLDKNQLKLYSFFIKKLGLQQKTYPIIGTKKEKTFGAKYLIYLSKKKDLIEKAVWYHHIYPRNKKIESENENIILGRLYGYPNCCIQVFLKNNKLTRENKDLEILLKVFKDSQSNIFPIYTNRFSPYKMILHLPHSFNCQASIKIGKQNLEILKNYDKKLYDFVLKKLNCCVIGYKNKILLINNFLVKDKSVIFKLKPQFWSEILPFSKAEKSFSQKTWLNVIAPFKSEGLYKIKTNNSHGIKVIIFSKI